jgi:hypothetical protein
MLLQRQGQTPLLRARIQMMDRALQKESIAIRTAIFGMFGSPLRGMFELLGIPWPWCWLALEVERTDLGLNDPRLPSRPGNFDILLGDRFPDGTPDFNSITAVEVKRLIIRPNDDMPRRSLGTEQAAGLKAFGFDRALLLHLVCRGRNLAGALSPFPMDDREPLTADLRRRMSRHLDRSCGWIAIRWAQDGPEGGSGYDPVFDIIEPPLLRPKRANQPRRYAMERLRPSTYRREAAREQVVRWLREQPQKELGWSPFPRSRALLIGAAALERSNYSLVRK